MQNLRSRPERPAFETPTIGLALGVYGLWFGLTYFYAMLPLWALIPLGAWTIAWQMSLQHETVHGHPTRLLWLNTLIGGWPLALWRPYGLYRLIHLSHHFESSLDDPETCPFDRERWAQLSPRARGFLRAESTLLGRLILGPACAAFRLGRVLVGRVSAGDRCALIVLARHAVGLTLVLYWVVHVCGMPLWLYGFIAYAGSALEMLRAFAQHRDGDGVTRRAATVENSPILGVLFLNNNLHGAHHFDRGAPWYRLRAIHQRHRDVILARNGGLVYDGYLDVARRHLLRPQEAPLDSLAARSS